MIYRIYTTVRLIEFRQKVVRGRTETFEGQKTAVLDKEPMGWYVNFEGSWESLCLGDDKPDLVKGQKVEISIRGL